MKASYLTRALTFGALAMAFSAQFGTSACSSGATSGAGADTTSSTTPREKLLARIATLSDKGLTAFGHHDDPVYGHTWRGDEGRSDLLETVGDYPAVMSWDLGMIELGDSANLDGVGFDRMRREVIAQDQRGGINTFSWHLRNPADPSTDSWFVADTTVVGRILTDPQVSARFDSWLANVGAFFNSLRRIDGSKIGVIFRPWHEHTGSWFWWGADLCSPAQYKALWERTRAGLDAAGVDNVVWAYSPDRVADEAQFMERYPGDRYVDLLGVDVYHFDGADGLEQYRADAARSLDVARKIAADRGKAVAFTETGSESLPMADWWDHVLLPLLREHPVSYVVVWRNAPDKPTHYYAPFVGEPSVASFHKLYNDSTIIFAKKMKEID